MIIIGSDHAGFKLKKSLEKWLDKKEIKYLDCGATEFQSQDSYVDYAKKSIYYFVKNCSANDKLVLVCGSGVGMSIVANRNKNIRAVLCWSTKQAKQARMHNNANCLCLGGRNTSLLRAKSILKAFLSTAFLGGKYQDRLLTIDNDKPINW